MSEVPELPRWTRVAAYALATDEVGRVLLVRVAPGYIAVGQWTLPGGGLDFGEDPAHAALRELAEEAGLTGRIARLAFIDSIVEQARPERGYGEWHGLRVVYRVEITGGELRDEVDESTDAAAWFTRSEIDALATVELVDRGLEYLDKDRKRRSDTSGTPEADRFARSRRGISDGRDPALRREPTASRVAGRRTAKQDRPGGGR
jgi:8-oxo-dGTP diphosphatase